MDHSMSAQPGQRSRSTIDYYPTSYHSARGSSGIGRSSHHMTSHFQVSQLPQSVQTMSGQTTFLQAAVNCQLWWLFEKKTGKNLWKIDLHFCQLRSPKSMSWENLDACILCRVEVYLNHRAWVSTTIFFCCLLLGLILHINTSRYSL